ncbi:MAG: FAD-dependent oxidoreductase, partial [Oscillospiraceae bacterium]
MSEEERFDAIVVGGGLSGITAAYVMAEAGLAVLLIEKGTYSGSKNVTGGRLYTHSLEKIIPDFEAKAPLERKIVNERFSARADEGFATWEYPSANIHEPEGSSYSVLRGKFDRWFADCAEDAGVQPVYGVKVDELLVRDGVVAGVVAGDEEMEANVVVLADGANSLLAQKLEMKTELNPKLVSVGAKEVLALAPAVIEERFALNPGEGLAWIFHGCATDNPAADGFLYTNKDSISVGITLVTESISHSEKSVPQLLEDFKHHPAIEKLLEGGSLLEYSAHLLPQGGNAMRPKLAGNGVLLVGDAAALCMDLGYSIRGMDLAIESGRLAAETIIAATKAK